MHGAAPPPYAGPYGTPPQYAAPYSAPLPYAAPYGAPPQYAAPYGAPAQYATPYGAPAQYAAPYGAPPQYSPAPYYGYPPAVPGMGYPAYPYPTPYYVMPPPGEKTFSGLKFAKYGLVIVVIANVLAALGNFLLLGAVRSMQDSLASMDLAQLLSSLAGIEALSALIILAALLGFIGVVVGLVGAFQLGKGAAEFGPNHQRAVRRAGALIGVTGALYLVWGLVNIFYSLSGAGALLGAPTEAEIQAMIEGLLTGLIVTSGIAIVAVLTGAVAMSALVEHLMTKAGRRRSGAFLGLSLGGAVLVFLMSIGIGLILSGPAPSLGNFQAILAWLGRLLEAMFWLALVPAVSSLVSVGSLAVYNGMLDAAADGARQMIVSQTLDPDLRAAAAPGPA